MDSTRFVSEDHDITPSDKDARLTCRLRLTCRPPNMDRQHHHRGVLMLEEGAEMPFAGSEGVKRTSFRDAGFILRHLERAAGSHARDSSVSPQRPCCAVQSYQVAVAM